MKWTVTTTENRLVTVTYLVEAEHEVEAKAKAVSGDGTEVKIVTQEVSDAEAVDAYPTVSVAK